jgi:hypothetical protein
MWWMPCRAAGRVPRIAARFADSDEDIEQKREQLSRIGN